MSKKFSRYHNHGIFHTRVQKVFISGNQDIRIYQNSHAFSPSFLTSPNMEYQSPYRIYLNNRLRSLSNRALSSVSILPGYSCHYQASKRQIPMQVWLWLVARGNKRIGKSPGSLPKPGDFFLVTTSLFIYPVNRHHLSPNTSFPKASLKSSTGHSSNTSGTAPSLNFITALLSLL